MEHTDDVKSTAGAPSALNIGLGEPKGKRPVAHGASRCPFCGSADVRESESKFILKGYPLKGEKSLRLFCADCGVNTGDNTFRIGDEQERRRALENATTNWNKRAPNAGVKAADEGSPATEGSEP